MYNSIKSFEEECIDRFEKSEDDFMKDPRKQNVSVNGATQKYCHGVIS